MGGLVIAYEPIWAIGTGRTATADDAQAVCAAIRRQVAELFDEDTAAAVRIQYGGSVKASNIAELMAQPDIDGALVGGASLDPDEFARIVQFDRVTRTDVHGTSVPTLPRTGAIDHWGRRTRVSSRVTGSWEDPWTGACSDCGRGRSASPDAGPSCART